MEDVFLPIISFLLGFIAGSLVRGILDVILYREANSEKQSFFDVLTSDRSFKLLIVSVVSAVWVFCVVIELFNPNYEVSPLVHGIFGTIVGFFFLKNENKQLVK